MKFNPNAYRSSLFYALLATVFTLTVCSCGGNTSTPEGTKNTAGKTKTPNTPTPTPPPVKTHEVLDATRNAFLAGLPADEADKVRKELLSFFTELKSHFSGDINCTLDSDTKINNQTFKEGSTVLHVLMSSLYFGLHGLRLVKDNGGDLGKKDKDGNTPLHNFVSYKDQQTSTFRDKPQYARLMEILDEEQATQLVKIQNNEGDSPLHIDALGDCRDSGMLIEALRNKLNDDEKTKKLVQNIKNNSGHTPYDVSKAATGYYTVLASAQYAPLMML